MFPRQTVEALDPSQVDHQQFCKAREREWIKWLVTLYACEIAQSQAAQFMLAAFFGRRENAGAHVQIPLSALIRSFRTAGAAKLRIGHAK